MGIKLLKVIQAEVVDTGTNGHFKVTTEGNERFRIASSGQIGLGGANYGSSGQVLTSNGASSAPNMADSDCWNDTFQQNQFLYTDCIRRQ